MRFLGRKPAKPTTRLFFATDLHGSETTFRKLLNAGQFYEANVLILGGDILGNLAIPIIREGAGRFRAALQGRSEQLDGEAALQEFQDRAGGQGSYTQVMSEDEFHALQADPVAVERLFHQLARQRLEAWIDLAEMRLSGTGIKCFVIGGNDDYPDVLEALDQASAENLVAGEGKALPLDDTHTLLSLGFSGPTPWRTPREVPEAQLEVMIESLVAQTPDPRMCVFNFHDPPVDSTLDTCPQLDWTTQPPAHIFKEGQVVLYGAGSRAVRAAIEKYQPLLGLHGHIHESPGAARIGRTLCVNPGSEYREGVLRGCLVVLANGKVESYQLTSG